MTIKRPKRTTGFAVPCSAEEKEELRQKAVARDMTVSAYVRWVLKNYPKADNRPRKAKEDGQNGEL